MEKKSPWMILQSIVNDIIGVILVGIMCVIFAQTFFRYVVFQSLPWSEELSRYLFVTLIALGINIGISQNMMVKIDLIDGVLPPAVKKWFNVGRQVIALVVAICFFYSCFDMIKIGRFQKSPALQLQMSVMYTIQMIGFGLAIISVVIQLVSEIKLVLAGGKK
jgi:TRAP-type C4-dicarboxylate transport system permease small subunit